MPNFISEDAIEQAILKRLHEQLGYDLLENEGHSPPFSYAYPLAPAGQ